MSPFFLLIVFWVMEVYNRNKEDIPSTGAHRYCYP
jgi:hypothetical protein